MREYARSLDALHPPVSGSGSSSLHFGDTPQVRRLRWIPWLQVAGLLLTVVVGLTMIRYQRRVEGERAWTAMARELAHQLGTPISSLQGWLELLRLPPGERPDALLEGEIAGGVRGGSGGGWSGISHRFRVDRQRNRKLERHVPFSRSCTTWSATSRAVCLASAPVSSCTWMCPRTCRS